MTHKLSYRVPSVYEERISEIFEILPDLKDKEAVDSILHICVISLNAQRVVEHDLELTYE